MTVVRLTYLGSDGPFTRRFDTAMGQEEVLEQVADLATGSGFMLEAVESGAESQVVYVAPSPRLLYAEVEVDDDE